MKHFHIELNKNALELIIDPDREHWYLLFPKHGQYASGQIGNGSFERNHNFVRVGSRDYELVFDCNDDATRWDSWSIFDVKKQAYLNQNGRI